MKRALHQSVVPLMAVVLTLVATLVCTSCGTDSRHFRIDGRLLHLNQGEFYVYSPDGTINGLDTIKVQAGRFSYEVACDRPMTLMIVFPNFTEQPVFAQPGKSVDLKGDASHLKEMTVKGTKDNELMNKFREMLHNAAPPEMKKCAQLFVEDHPESRVGAYLVDRYFIHDANPDTKTAVRRLFRGNQRCRHSQRPGNHRRRQDHRACAAHQSPRHRGVRPCHMEV